jgi:hypothetical protein
VLAALLVAVLAGTAAVAAPCLSQVVDVGVGDPAVNWIWHASSRTWEMDVTWFVSFYCTSGKESICKNFYAFDLDTAIAKPPGWVTRQYVCWEGQLWPCGANKLTQNLARCGPIPPGKTYRVHLMVVSYNPVWPETCQAQVPETYFTLTGEPPVAPDL